MKPLIWTNGQAAVVFWLVFVAWGALEWYPILAERRAGTTRGRSSSRAKRSGYLLFGTIYTGYLLAFLAALFITRAALPGSGWIPYWTGLALIGAGLVLRWRAVHELAGSFTRELTILPGHTVVTSGPYRFIRHPGYLGGWISCAGVGVALGNWISIAASTVCSGIGFVWRIRVEEEILDAGLAASYRGYARSTRYRLIPGIW